MKQTNSIYQVIRRLADGMLPAAYRNRVLRWLLNDEQAEEKDKALFQLWNETKGNEVLPGEIQASLLAVKTRLGLMEEKGQKKKSYSLFSSWFKYAAVFLLPLISGMTVWFLTNRMYESESRMVECFVPKGEQKSLLLPDGTRVMLNSGTLFIYPEKYEERRCF